MIKVGELAIVTSPKLYQDATYEKIDEDGLLSQRIFGPLKNFRCLCGTLTSKINHSGQRCKKCGVLCSTNDERYKTFAKIALPLPIYKPTKKNKARLRNIVKIKFKHILDPIQSDLTTSTSNYLLYKPADDKISITDVYVPGDCIPITITGTYTLYLAIKSCWICFGSTKCREIVEDIFTYNLLVTPPGTRHFFVKKQDGKTSITRHPINKIFSSVIKLSNYDWTHIMDPIKNEEMYLNMIQKTIGGQLPIVEEDLKFYDQLVCKYQYYTNNIYDMIIESLSTKQGLIRKDFLGRSIDFSSRSHIIVDLGLSAYEIRIPKNNFLRLWFIEFIRYLREYKDIKFEDALVFIKLTESSASITNQYSEYIDDFIKYSFSENVNYRNKLVLINRQPTLWRYGIPAVRVIGVSDGDSITISPLLLEQMNADFDGDTIAIYRIHDVEAQEELERKAYVMNNIIYDHNFNYIHTIRIESAFAAHVLLSAIPDNTKNIIKINNLSDLPADDEKILFEPTTPVSFKNNIYSYGICLFNKLCQFNDIIINSYVSPNEISRELATHTKTNKEYHDRLTYLNGYLHCYATLNYNSPLTLSLDEITSLNVNKHKPLLEKLPKNPYIGQHVYKGIIERLYDDIPKEHFFSKLIRAKLGKVGTQLSRMIGAIGYIADDKNIISSNAISQSVLNGLSPDPFFRTAKGARKGLVDKSNITPKSGYLERSMVINLSPVEIGNNDCYSSIGFNIHIMTYKHARSLINRYFNENGHWKLFKEKHINMYMDQTLLFRSPITCKEPNFKICRKCFGEYHIKSPYVGVLAGQYISERLTQLSMRTL